MLQTEKAHAKINLILDVLGKRADGYHEIKTIFQSLSLADTLIFADNKSDNVSLTCTVVDLPLGQENLVWQAANLLREHYGVSDGVHIHLDKRIPVSAGLGGGSSDAAAALRGLVHFWALPHEPTVLTGLAAQLGSDVPFCLGGGTALGSGRGEHVEPLPSCPHFHVVLANPGFAVSTAKVYQGYVPDETRLRPDIDAMMAALEAKEKAGVMSKLANVLESSTFALYPKVQHVKARMQQAGPALMCGSGATVFALFATATEATRLHAALQKEGMSAWLTETKNNEKHGGD